MTVGNPFAPIQPTQRSVKFSGTSSTDTILTGQVLCCDPSQTDDDQQALVFAQTSYANRRGPFFVVDQASPSGTVSGGMVRGFLISGESIVMQVRVDQTVAAGDYGGIHAGTYNFRKGRLLGPLCCRFLDSVTVSSGTAMVLAEVGLNINFGVDGVRAVQQDEFNDFYCCGTITAATTANAAALGWINQGDITPTGATGPVVGSATGTVMVRTDGDANDEAYLACTKYFKITNPFYVRGRMALTETNGSGGTHDAGFIFGLKDTATAAPSVANQIIDTSFVPEASSDQAVFYKLAASGTWAARGASSANATNTVNSASLNLDSDVGTFSSGTFVVFEIIRLVAGGSIYFYVDGVLQHTVSSTGLPSGSDALVVAGCKTLDTNAAGTTEQLLTVDYIEVQNPLY